jgi:putative colanic acid biosynthesis acetyltransferase WcaF
VITLPMQASADLSKYHNEWYEPGMSLITRVLWYIVNRVFFISGFPLSVVKILLLRVFGAKVGKGVILKPYINIKYPWKLCIGDYSWIGEGSWIDNLEEVVIGNNCCISQGALLLCGNHNYKKSSFDLITGKIVLEDGVWLCAKSIVCGGVTCRSHAVLTTGSVAVNTLDAYAIYQGNPAVKVKTREITLT